MFEPSGTGADDAEGGTMMMVMSVDQLCHCGGRVERYR